MNKKAKELIGENRKIRAASFILFCVGVFLCYKGAHSFSNIFLLTGLPMMGFGFYLFEMSNYHLGALKGYDMGYYDSVRGNNYNVLFSPKDASLEKSDIG